MTLSNDNQTAAVFKTFYGKSHTDDSKGLNNEAEAAAVTTPAAAITGESIDSTPSQAVTDGVAEQLTDCVLVEDATSNGHAFFIQYPVGHGLEGQRVDLIIGAGYGSGYQPVLKDSTKTEIPLGDARDWFVQYESAVVFQQTADASPAPAYLDCYRYIGNTAQDYCDHIEDETLPYTPTTPSD